MAEHDPAAETTRTVRFHEYGEPADVLHLETAPVAAPGPGRIRVVVHACGLNPADWALCRGLFPGKLPRGIGCEVSGTVEAIGDGVTDIAVGDRVFGTADFANEHSAGAADRAIMDAWFAVPEGLDLTQAAALPMALSTAYWHLARLGLSAGRTILINGAGTTVGYAAVQIALIRGMRVIATAGETYAAQLRDLGATVTTYGDGLVDRVKAISDGPVDLVFDTWPPHRSSASATPSTRTGRRGTRASAMASSPSSRSSQPNASSPCRSPEPSRSKTGAPPSRPV
jgi:NADPH:quinone reductase-like Zn-dependent oxidoreductase